MKQLLEIKSQKELKLVSGGNCICLRAYAPTAIPTPISTIRLESKCKNFCCDNRAMYYSFKGVINKCFEDQSDLVIASEAPNAKAQQLIELGVATGQIVSSLRTLGSYL